MSESQVRALKAERERHVSGDRPERVAQIDAELAALGAAVADSSDEVRTTAARRPKK